MMLSLGISRPESKFKVFPSNSETGDPSVSSWAFFLCSLTAGVTTQLVHPRFTDQLASLDRERACVCT